MAVTRTSCAIVMNAWMLACNQSHAPTEAQATQPTQAQPTQPVRRHLINGHLDAYVTLPHSATQEAVTRHGVDWVEEKFTVHLDAQTIDIIDDRYPCNTANYRTPNVSDVVTLASESLADGYAVKLELREPRMNDGEPLVSRFAVEVCSSRTHTVCAGEVSRRDDEQLAAIMSICKSIGSAK